MFIALSSYSRCHGMIMSRPREILLIIWSIVTNQSIVHTTPQSDLFLLYNTNVSYQNKFVEIDEVCFVSVRITVHNVLALRLLIMTDNISLMLTLSRDMGCTLHSYLYPLAFSLTHKLSVWLLTFKSWHLLRIIGDCVVHSCVSCTLLYGAIHRWPKLATMCLVRGFCYCDYSPHQSLCCSTQFMLD